MGWQRAQYLGEFLEDEELVIGLSLSEQSVLKEVVRRSGGTEKKRTIVDLD